MPPRPMMSLPGDVAGGRARSRSPSGTAAKEEKQVPKAKAAPKPKPKARGKARVSPRGPSVRRGLHLRLYDLLEASLIKGIVAMTALLVQGFCWYTLVFGPGLLG